MKKKKKKFAWIYLRKNTSDDIIFSAAVGMRVYHFTKKKLHHRCFPVKLVWRFREHHYCRTLLGNCFWYSATFPAYRLVFQQYINVVTTSCLEFPGKAICKQSTVFTLKKFRVNKKKARSRVTFCGRSRLNKPEST